MNASIKIHFHCLTEISLFNNYSRQRQNLNNTLQIQDISDERRFSLYMHYGIQFCHICQVTMSVHNDMKTGNLYLFELILKSSVLITKNTIVL